MNSLQKAIAYIETNLYEEVGAEDVAKVIRMPLYHFQQGFQVITGYSVSEYVRCRRLYLAALAVLDRHRRIIDIAYAYGYSTPDSFTKAFSRFHGVSPMQLREHPERMRVFLPLKIKISIQGGEDMDYTVEKEAAFRMAGLPKVVDVSSSYREIPVLWDEFYRKYHYRQGVRLTDETEQAICDHQIGEYGVCLDDLPEKGKFRYLIAGIYTGGRVPSELDIVDFPAMEWAKFRCMGPLPAALQAVNTIIFKEWLPNNPEYEICMGASLERYTKSDIQSVDYISEIWIPVKRRED
ncbi:AraC family transcriptional regulator [Pectinatus frisingensis]|uniref:AraC family transcriptional regulator n=1 Tax=Pectinatus frisingensis TaxID=865 RepID=UPI0018C833D2|nr:AraC family transcriptional regulator [Pectinatus frisingensis]